MVVYRPGGESESAGALILDFESPELWDINVYCLSCSVSGTLLLQPKQTNNNQLNLAVFQKGQLIEHEYQ